MRTPTLPTVTLVALLSSTALACVAHAATRPTAAPPTAASAPPPGRATAASTSAPSSVANARSSDPPRPIYRFDFVLSSTDGTHPATNTTFTLNLEEHNHGELMSGKNVPLTVTAPRAATREATPAAVVPRRDVGLKVGARFEEAGPDVLLFVETEVSSLESPSTVHKLVATGNALASPGKPTVVATLDDTHERYQLTVTATRLR